MRFNKAKCKVLHLGCGKPCYQYKLQDGKTEQSPAKKDLGELVDGKLDISSNVHSQPENQQYPGLHPKQHGQQGEGLLLPLYSVLARPQLENCI